MSKPVFHIVLLVLLFTTSWSLVVKPSPIQRYGRGSHRSGPLMAMSDPISVADAITTVTTTAPRVFEPQFDSVGPMLLVISMCAISGAYWWNVVIPDRRTELALSKRKGDVKEYLDELREAAGTGDKAVERWLLTDWLRENKSAKPGALPFLKKAKWNSGDNPILVAFGGIMALVFSAALAERISF